MNVGLTPQPIIDAGLAPQPLMNWGPLIAEFTVIQVIGLLSLKKTLSDGLLLL
jgi:hypothetical protein